MRDAARLKLLVDAHGTSDIGPLGVQALRRQGITFTAHHYDSDQEGVLITIAEAEPLRGHPSGELLETAAQIGATVTCRGREHVGERLEEDPREVWYSWVTNSTGVFPESAAAG